MEIKKKMIKFIKKNSLSFKTNLSSSYVTNKKKAHISNKNTTSQTNKQPFNFFDERHFSTHKKKSLTNKLNESKYNNNTCNELIPQKILNKQANEISNYLLSNLKRTLIINKNIKEKHSKNNFKHKNIIDNIINKKHLKYHERRSVQPLNSISLDNKNSFIKFNNNSNKGSYNKKISKSIFSESSCDNSNINLIHSNLVNNINNINNSNINNITNNNKNSLENFASIINNINSKYKLLYIKIKSQNYLKYISKDIIELNNGYRNLFLTQKLSDSEFSSDICIEIDDSSKYVISPINFYLILFDFIIFFLIFFQLIFVPYCFAFNKNILFYLNINVIIDIFFIIDFFIGFFRGFLENNKINNNLKDCIFHYLNNDFFFNLLMDFPYNIFISVNFHKDWIKIIPMIRIFKFKNFLYNDELNEYFYEHKIWNIHTIKPLSVYNPFISFVEFFIGLLLTIHIGCCILILISSHEKYPNWNYNNSNFFPNYDQLTIYLASIYYILSTIISVGYGDITVVTLSERIYNVILMIFGVVLYSCVLSILSSLFESWQFAEMEKNKEINLLNKLISNRNNSYIKSSRLYLQILRYLKHKIKLNSKKKNFLIDSLPKYYQCTLLYEIYKKDLNSLTFFKGKKNEFKYQAVLYLNEINFMKNEFIVQTDDMIEEIFMINQGTISFQKETNYNGHVIKILKYRKNEHFGEIYMALSIPIPYDVIVVSKYAQLLFIQKNDFLKLYENFPYEIESILQIALQNTIRIETRAKYLFEKGIKEDETNFNFYTKNSDINENNNLTESINNKKINNKNQLTIIKEEINSNINGTVLYGNKIKNSILHLNKTKSDLSNFENNLETEKNEDDIYNKSYENNNYNENNSNDSFQIKQTQAKPKFTIINNNDDNNSSFEQNENNELENNKNDNLKEIQIIDEKSENSNNNLNNKNNINDNLINILSSFKNNNVNKDNKNFNNKDSFSSTIIKRLDTKYLLEVDNNDIDLANDKNQRRNSLPINNNENNNTKKNYDEKLLESNISRNSKIFKLPLINYINSEDNNKKNTNFLSVEDKNTKSFNSYSIKSLSNKNIDENENKVFNREYSLKSNISQKPNNINNFNLNLNLNIQNNININDNNQKILKNNTNNNIINKNFTNNNIIKNEDKKSLQKKYTSINLVIDNLKGLSENLKNPSNFFKHFNKKSITHINTFNKNKKIKTNFNNNNNNNNDNNNNNINNNNNNKNNNNNINNNNNNNNTNNNYDNHYIIINKKKKIKSIKTCDILKQFLKLDKIFETIFIFYAYKNIKRKRTKKNM